MQCRSTPISRSPSGSAWRAWPRPGMRSRYSSERLRSVSVDYDRRRVDERIAAHDRHFDMINGSLKDILANLSALNLGMQRLVDSAEADRATVITTAKALRDAEDARRDKGEARWSPVQRLAALLGSLAAAVGVLYEVLHH